VLAFGEVQALKYQEAFRRTFELLAWMPSMGRLSERHEPNERRFVQGVHVIYYTIFEGGIQIETIVYGPLITDIWGDA